MTYDSYALYGAIYASRCGFANMEAFVDAVLQRIPDLAAISDGDEFVDTVSQYLGKQTDANVINSEISALNALLCSDMDRMCQALRSIDLPSVDLDAALSVFLNAAGDMGLGVTSVNMQIVDEFPAPFDNPNLSAFAPDAEDERRYGVEQGIYFRRNKLRPFYSEALLAHELVHLFPGRAGGSEILAMGLEEGLADLIGMFGWAPKRVPEDVVYRIYAHGRHGIGRSQLWDLYRDHTRQASWIHRNYGVEGVVELLNSGREKVHMVERLLLSGNTDLPLPRGGVVNPDIDRRASYLLLGFVPSLVMSPLKRWLVPYVEEGRKLQDICDSARVPGDIGSVALRELSRATGLFLIEDDAIAFSNAAFYSEVDGEAEIPVLRYLIPGG